MTTIACWTLLLLFTAWIAWMVRNEYRRIQQHGRHWKLYKR